MRIIGFIAFLVGLFGIVLFTALLIDQLNGRYHNLPVSPNFHANLDGGAVFLAGFLILMCIIITLGYGYALHLNSKKI